MRAGRGTERGRALRDASREGLGCERCVSWDIGSGAQGRQGVANLPQACPYIHAGTCRTHVRHEVCGARQRPFSSYSCLDAFEPCKPAGKPACRPAAGRPALTRDVRAALQVELLESRQGRQAGHARVRQLQVACAGGRLPGRVHGAERRAGGKPGRHGKGKGMARRTQAMHAQPPAPPPGAAPAEMGDGDQAQPANMRG